MMGDLPSSSVTPNRAFSRTGMDFARPFQIKTRKGKGTKSVKVYMYVYFNTKAVPLEQSDV